jgi:hypothetical protein
MLAPGRKGAMVRFIGSAVRRPRMRAHVTVPAPLSGEGLRRR